MKKCVVLPSCREGTPRTLLEVDRMRPSPIITINVAGYRQVVENGKIGFLGRVRDSNNLADSIEIILILSKAALKDMELKGREKIKREFDGEIILEKYLEVL